GLLSGGGTWPDFAIRLLAAYRVRLRAFFDTAEAFAKHSLGDGRNPGNLRGHGRGRRAAQSREGPRAASAGVLAPAGRCTGVISKMVTRFFRKQRQRKLNVRDLERINAAADRLNREAEEVLEYQADDETRSVDD